MKDQFFLILETVDSQLDFNSFVIKYDDDFNLDWELIQSREVVPRKIFDDPIKKMSFVYQNGINHAIALRAKGDIDIYWNMQRVDSSHDLGATDIALSFDTSYWQMTNDKGEVTYKQLDHYYEKELRVKLMEDISFPDFDIKKVFYQRVKLYVDMYQSSCLIRTSLWVAHNKFVSVFSILKKKWTNHVKFSEYVTLFRKKEGEELFTAGIMYPQGEIFTEVKKVVDEGKSPDGNYSFETVEPNYKLQGTPFQTIIDVEDNRWFSFLSENEEGEVFFETMFQDKLYEI